MLWHPPVLMTGWPMMTWMMVRGAIAMHAPHAVVSNAAVTDAADHVFKRAAGINLLDEEGEWRVLRIVREEALRCVEMKVTKHPRTLLNLLDG